MRKDVINDERDAAARRRRAYAEIRKTRLHCDLCRSSFTSLSNSLAHFKGKAHKKAIDLKNGPYDCGPCDKSFKRKNEYQQHIESKAHLSCIVDLQKRLAAVGSSL